MDPEICILENEKMKKILIIASYILFLTTALSISYSIVNAQEKNLLIWPKVTTENKPCVYWWWMGSAVNKEDLKTLLEEYNQAGLGGTRVIPIYGAKGYEDEYIDFLTPEWMEMLAYTAKVSAQLKMKVELAASTGWNMGGPWVNLDDVSKRVVLEKYTLKGGQKMKEP